MTMSDGAPPWVVEAVGLTRVFPDAVAVRALDGVDVRIARGEVVKRFQSLAHEHGKTIVLVTHDPVVALAAGRIITLRDGRIDQDEQVDEAYVNQLNALRPTPLGRLLFGERPVAGSSLADASQPPAQRLG